MLEQWIVDLTDEVETPSKAKLYAKSIYRVPKFFSNFNPQAYKPMLASFGPYHHGCRDLQHMEQHKHHALVQFFRRIGKASKTVNDVVKAMSQVMASLLNSYDSLDSTKLDENCDCGSHSWWDNSSEEAFLQMIITDGCFALEVMLLEIRSKAGESSKNDLKYDLHDPVFGTMRNKFIAPYLARDMLLLENQLPFIALTTLAAIEGSEVGDVSALIKEFYHIYLASTDSLINKDWHAPSVQIFHILNMFRQILRDAEDYLPSDNDNVQSCTMLEKAGDNSKNESFIVINLNGIDLPLPIIGMNKVTESMLLNVIVFDSLHATVDDKVTATNEEVTTVDDEVTLADDEFIEMEHSDESNESQFTDASSKEDVKSIYRIPKIFTVNNRKAYEPILASFGPYHYGCPNLRYMEEHKRSAHNRYLSRIHKAFKTQEDVLIAMRNVESHLLGSYDSLHIEGYDEEQFERVHRHDWLKEKDEFLNLMIVDGCFALEVMLADANDSSTFEREDDTNNHVFVTKKVKYLVPYLARDMLLLENQLPFLALTILANIKGSGIKDVAELIIAFYKLSLASTDNKITSYSWWMELGYTTMAVAWVGHCLGAIDCRRHDFLDRDFLLRRCPSRRLLRGGISCSTTS